MMVIIAFDASTTGAGAAVWTAAAGSAPAAVVDSRPDEYFSCQWTAADERRLSAKRGDPASQARWEALALLLALSTWRARVLDEALPVHFVGDALGVLHGRTSLRARDPGVNAIAMEMALLLAPGGLELAATHLWSDQNSMTDALSRLGEGALLPVILDDVPCAAVRRPAWRILGRLRVRPPARRK